MDYQNKLEQCIRDLDMFIQQENHTIEEKDLKKLKKELQELKDELIHHIDDVS